MALVVTAGCAEGLAERHFKLLQLGASFREQFSFQGDLASLDLGWAAETAAPKFWGRILGTVCRTRPPDPMNIHKLLNADGQP